MTDYFHEKMIAKEFYLFEKQRVIEIKFDIS
jgi:hypothetical protein